MSTLSADIICRCPRYIGKVKLVRHNFTGLVINDSAFLIIRLTDDNLYEIFKKY